jgi:hypothetical protein
LSLFPDLTIQTPERIGTITVIVGATSAGNGTKPG